MSFQRQYPVAKPVWQTSLASPVWQYENSCCSESREYFSWISGCVGRSFARHTSCVLAAKIVGKASDVQKYLRQSCVIRMNTITENFGTHLLKPVIQIKYKNHRKIKCQFIPLENPDSEARIQILVLSCDESLLILFLGKVKN